MAGEDGENVGERISKSVEVADVAPMDLDGREYDILGIRFESEFEIGISHSDNMEPLGEIIPEEVYQAVAAIVREEIDVDAIDIHQHNEDRPKLGNCVLEASESALEVEITIFERASG